MKKLLLILLCLPFIGFGQNVYIPDANFKAYLVGNTAINTNGDAEIQVSEATVFNGDIYCQGMSIADLTGIEAFTALTYLNCEDNQLTSLDISNNLALNSINCSNNQLTSIDVSAATALINLQCYDNQLTSLNINQNTALIYLYCSYNQIISLDISQNPSLISLNCSYNQLVSLDVRNGNNIIIDTLQHSIFRTKNNPTLSCINVDDAAWSTATWTNIDPQHYFSNNCNTTAIQEHTTNKELLKVTDLLGRETKQTNQPLFYIYDDGTVEKRIVIE
jgi:hypothetical protein